MNAYIYLPTHTEFPGIYQILGVSSGFWEWWQTFRFKTERSRTTAFWCYGGRNATKQRNMEDVLDR